MATIPGFAVGEFNIARNVGRNRLMPGGRYRLFVRARCPFEPGVFEGSSTIEFDVLGVEILNVLQDETVPVGHGGLTVNLHSSNRANTTLHWELLDITNPHGSQQVVPRTEIPGTATSFNIPSGVGGLMDGREYHLIVRAGLRGSAHQVISSRVFSVEAEGNRMMENLANDTTLAVSAGRRGSMVIVGQFMLNNGYEPSFVAGMLGNIRREGDFGLFEIAGNDAFIASDQPYLRYFVDNHNYRTRFSNRLIYNVDVTLRELHDITSNRPTHEGSANRVNIFGLGISQWTNEPRFFSLLQLYKEISGSDGRITREHTIQAETALLLRELTGEGNHTGPYGAPNWGFNLPNVWRARNTANLHSEAAAMDAAYLLTRSFFRPAGVTAAAAQRREDAMEVFRIMMQ